MKIIFLGIVIASVFAMGAETISGPIRTQYIQVFQDRVETLWQRVEKKRWQVARAKSFYDQAVKMNEKVPGAVALMQVREYLLAWEQAKMDLSILETEMKEAEVVVSLIQKTLPLGLAMPIVVDFQ